MNQLKPWTGSPEDWIASIQPVIPAVNDDAGKSPLDKILACAVSGARHGTICVPDRVAVRQFIPDNFLAQDERIRLEKLQAKWNLFRDHLDQCHHGNIDSTLKTSRQLFAEDPSAERFAALLDRAESSDQIRARLGEVERVVFHEACAFSESEIIPFVRELINRAIGILRPHAEHLIAFERATAEALGLPFFPSHSVNCFAASLADLGLILMPGNLSGFVSPASALAPIINL